MSKMNIERKAKIRDDGLIQIDIEGYEEISVEEYKLSYEAIKQKAYQLKQAVSQGKEQLKALEEHESTPELEKFCELLAIVKENEKRDKLMSDMQGVELELQAKEKELENLTPMIIQLNAKKKKKKVDGDTK